VEGKVVIYQLLLRAFGKRKSVPGGSYNLNGSGKFDDITDEVLKKIKKLSVSAIWYTGVISHATKTHFHGIKDCNPSIVKGEAGSPYAIRNYFDVSPALANNHDNRMAEFEALIRRTHKAGMKVIIDFVPNHVFRQYDTYFKRDNFHILNGPLVLPESLNSDYVENPAKATGNDVFHTSPSINDWYDTVKLNYDNRDTWFKMLEVLKFWAAKGVDGFRCDMVEMVPAEFFGWAISEIKYIYPNTFFIAEVYGKENYRRYHEIGGFDLLYDKSGFYDTLRSIICDGASTRLLTGEWQFLGDLQPGMLNFLENHDEQRIASDFFAGSGRAAFPALAVSLLFNRAPFMLYFGQEFGERGMEQEGFSGLDGRTSIFDYCTVPSIRRWLLDRLTVDELVVYKEYGRLLKIATSDAIFAHGETFDLMYANPDSERFNGNRQFAFMRGYEDACMLVVANFDGRPAEMEVNIPSEAYSFFGINKAGERVRLKVGANDYTRVNLV
jgi:glycosidase